MLRYLPDMLNFIQNCKMTKKAFEVVIYLLHLLSRTNDNKFYITESELAHLLNTNKSTIYRSLSELKKINVIEKMTDNATTFFRFKPLSEWVYIPYKEETNEKSK